MLQKIFSKFYQPTLFFFLLPVFQIILGMIFSLRYDPLNILSFFVLYLFVLFNQMLENILLRIPVNDFSFSKGFFFSVQTLNLLTILYFGLRHSWMASVVLILFSLIIQGQFLFSYYDLETYATILSVSLKTIFLNSFSFFIGTGFIQFRFVLYFLGLLLPFFLYEIARVQPEMTKKVITTIVVLSYIIGVTLLWPHLNVISLLLILCAPFAWETVNGKFSRKSTSVFAINFSLFYVILLMFSVIK